MGCGCGCGSTVLSATLSSSGLPPFKLTSEASRDIDKLGLGGSMAVVVAEDEQYVDEGEAECLPTDAC